MHWMQMNQKEIKITKEQPTAIINNSCQIRSQTERMLQS